MSEKGVQLGLKKVSVNCYVFNKKTGKFLMMKRLKEPHIGGYIAPGGKLEPFEDPNTCVVREILEETGLRIKKPILAGVLQETSNTKFNWSIWFYKAQTNQTKVKNGSPHEGTLEWIDKDKMLEIDIPECDKFIVAKLLANEFFAFNAWYDDDIELVKLTDELTGEVMYK